jgi:hypothetical protein
LFGSRHVPQLSGNGREDTGGKGDTIDRENETSGTGLTTGQKNWEFAMRARRKKGHEIAARKEKEWKSRQEEQSDSEERESSKVKTQMLLAEQDQRLSGQRKNLHNIKR